MGKRGDTVENTDREIKFFRTEGKVLRIVWDWAHTRRLMTPVEGKLLGLVDEQGAQTTRGERGFEQNMVGNE